MADPDVQYALNRLLSAIAPEGAASGAAMRFPVKRSFAAFIATKRHETQSFNEKIAELNKILDELNSSAEDAVLLELAAQSGAPIAALRALRVRLGSNVGNLPTTISDWISWIFTWLAEDEYSRSSLLGRERGALLSAVGRKVDSELSSDALNELLPGVLAWLHGKPLNKIEEALGGLPKSRPECPRARRLITSLVPLGLTFIAGLVARTAQEIQKIASGEATPRSVIETLPTAVRRGFDFPAKLAFAEEKKGPLCRVQFHRAYAVALPQGVMVDSSDDYGSVIERVRFLLDSSTLGTF
jgi:hypothetical protein